MKSTLHVQGNPLSADNFHKQALRGMQEPSAVLIQV